MGLSQKFLCSTCGLLSTFELSSEALGVNSEENRESAFNTVAHSFIRYKLSLYDSPGPVLCAGADVRMMGGLYTRTSCNTQL